MSRVLKLALVVVAAACVAVTAFFVSGGRWFNVVTPSMGEYAPVGTAVFSGRVAFESLRVDDLILFTPPGVPDQVYFHRVVSTAGGVLHTKGDLNAAVDPWVLTAADVVGKELGHVVGLGWLVLAVPFLLAGVLLTVFVTRTWVTPAFRLPAVVLASAVVLSVAGWILRPFVRAVLVSQTAVNGVADFRVVPTGLFDLRATAVQGTSAVLRPGQLGSVTSSWRDSLGFSRVELTPALSVAQWVVVGTVWALPTVVCGWHLWRTRNRGPGNPLAVAGSVDAEPT